MHYEISYKGMDRAAKRQKALDDCRDYLGDERFKDLTNQFRVALHYNPNRKMIRSLVFAMSFAGVQGYPARAFTMDAFRNRNQH